MVLNDEAHLYRQKPKKGHGKAAGLDPLKLPTPLITGLEAMYGHYAKTCEIDRCRREIVERSGDPRAADTISDPDLLREVMNTVGKAGRMGESIRCVVSVSMLTEGWDTNTVTHVLGVRDFGTQLLCEQVIGRALRRLSYELNGEGLFNVEYADLLGIPFDFKAEPWGRRRRSRAKPSTSRPCGPSAMGWKSASPVCRAIAWNCPKTVCKPSSTTTPRWC